MICKKCGNDFTPTKGLISYCSLSCRNSRGEYGEEIKNRISTGVKNSEKCKNAWKKQKGFSKKFLTVRNTKQPVSHKEFICLHCGEIIVEKRYKKWRKYHKDCWKTVSGGYRVNSTRKHTSIYKGRKMASGAELGFAMFCDANDIEWVKNQETYFEYIGVDGKSHKYYPDFYLPSYDVWVEIKGKRYADLDKNVHIKRTLIKRYLYVDSKEVVKLTLDTLVEKVNNLGE